MSETGPDQHTPATPSGSASTPPSTPGRESLDGPAGAGRRNWGTARGTDVKIVLVVVAVLVVAFVIGGMHW